MKTNAEVIRKFFKGQEVEIFGWTDLTEIKEKILIEPAPLLNKMNTGISFGFRLSQTVLDTLTDGPNFLYYHYYKQVNYFLDRTALLLSDFLQKKGSQALPIPASQIIDWEKQKSYLSHKEIAKLAGLGWIGRNNLLVHPQFGSQVRYVTVLTNLKLSEKKTITFLPTLEVAFNCGDCYACSKICPAGAIKEKMEDFDLFACFQKLRDFSRERKIGQYICGLCIKVCPGNPYARNVRRI